MSSFVDAPAIAFSVLGAGALAASFLPRLLDRRALSLPIVFLAVGAVVFMIPGLPITPDPSDHRALVQRITEITVILSLMGAGLRIDRLFSWRSWRTTWRLLAITMPLTIVAVTLLGVSLLGLSVASAVLLAAVLAPTDPVLASDVQVGEPSEDPDSEDEVRFGLTSEAALNDGLAFPFTYAAIAMVEKGAAPSGWVVHWLSYSVAYKIAVGLVAGLVIGWVLGKLIFQSRLAVFRLAEHREGIVAIGATLLSYGLTELINGYGFIAVFVAASVIRASERSHGYHHVLHDFTDQVERLLTVLVLLLVGGALTAGGLLADLTLPDVLLAALVLLVVRPVAGWVALAGLSSGRGEQPAAGPSGGFGDRPAAGRPSVSRGERAALAFFGVRGIGSVYYLAYALGAASFDDTDQLWAVVGLVVAASVVLHGVTATPVMRRLDHRRERTPAPA